MKTIARVLLYIAIICYGYSFVTAEIAVVQSIKANIMFFLVCLSAIVLTIDYIIDDK